MKNISGKRLGISAIVSGLGLILLISGCALFEDEQTAKGRKLYHHYCMHCHGENGRQNEGFNWSSMSDPRPRDLSDKAAMSTFSDEEIFSAVSREMRDTSKEEVLNDENYFAVSTMPTFKYTLSEKEIWGVIGYVRTLHGMSLTYDLEARQKELQGVLQEAEQALEAEKPVLEAAELKLEEAEEARSDDDDETILPEEEALEEVQAKFDGIQDIYDQAKAAVDNFSKRPKMNQVSRPDLAISEEELPRLEEVGKQLYQNKYGCNGCHSINEQGGLVGPALDRAGFRLNDTWVYRWIRYPQGMKKHTRMPNLGINDQDARAVTAYLETLRAPKPDQPIAAPE
ncbi:MAG: c-type cytochrome [Nitrospirales bacterium]|nr:c-type cytochrome [Nitrospirales bacterium]